MAKKTPTRKGLARRAQILDAALEILAEGGPEALTVARLAGALGMATGALYRHFDSKEAVLVALQIQAIEAFQDALEARLDRARAALGGEPLALALVGLTAWYDEATVDPTRYWLVDAFLSAPAPVLTDEQARAVEAALGPLLARCDDLLEVAAAAGALAPGDARQRTYCVWAALHGLGHFRKRDRILPEPLRTPALRDALLRGLFLGWGADPERLEAALVANPPSPG